MYTHKIIALSLTLIIALEIFYLSSLYRELQKYKTEEKQQSVQASIGELHKNDWELAKFYYFSKNREKALPYLYNILFSNPHHPEKNTIEQWINDIKHSEKTSSYRPLSIQKYKKIIENAPHDPKSYLELAKIYHEHGFFDTAIPYWSKAITLGNNDPVIFQEVGLLLQNSDPKKAIQHLEQTKQLENDDDKKRKIDELITSLRQKLQEERQTTDYSVLKKMLESDRFVDRQIALQQLRRLQSANAVALLYQAMKASKYQKTQMQAAQILCEMGTSESQQQIKTALFSEEEDKLLKQMILNAYRVSPTNKDTSILEAWSQHPTSKDYRDFLNKIRFRAKKD